MNPQADSGRALRRERILAALAGAWLGVSLLKFGNPVIFNDKVVPPRGLLEWLIQPWPVGWGYAMFAAVALAGLLVWRWRTAPPKWILLLPAAWFGWQVISATQSVQPRLSSATLAHFACCTGCFYLGLFALSRLRSLTPLWLGWMAGFACVLAVGLDQHFGGLEETRRWFFLYQFPKLADPPSAEFLQKLHSDRVYSTLFYPNTLAGVILLVLPMMLGFLWRVGNVTRSVRIVLVAGLGMASLACLWWSGSKAGWLILLVVALAAFVRMPILPKVKAAVIGLMLFAGLAGFFAKYQGYFSRGATSAAARLDYWKAASQVIREHPVVGSGPGTFGVVYQQIKGPQSEMARLAHNDYLQQGSDSGVVGMLAYVGLWVGSMVLLYRSSCLMPGAFCVWLGLLGLGLQGFVEFGLFIPALAWPQYLFLGWLWGRDSDRQQPQPPLGSKHR